MEECFSLLRAKGRAREYARASAARRSKGDGRLIRGWRAKVCEKDTLRFGRAAAASTGYGGKSRLSSDKRRHL